MNNTARKEKTYKGLAVSPGVVQARVVLIKDNFQKPEIYSIDESQIEQEIINLKNAVKKTSNEIEKLKNEISGEVENENASIFDAHIMILKDDIVLSEAYKTISEKKQNADAVFYKIMNRYAKSLEKIDDVYLRDRAFDIKDVARRVIINMNGGDTKFKFKSKVKDPYIIIAHELTAVDTLNLNRKKVLAFATEIGSYTSHTAIMAHSLNIPAIVGLDNICNDLENGDMVILDGFSGNLIAFPSEETIEKYEQYNIRNREIEEQLYLIKNKECCTEDDHNITLSANIEFEQEALSVVELGGEGVGLFRTEYLYLNNSILPDEESQYEKYSNIVKKISPEQVIFRTLDVGGDKIKSSAISVHESNPFLGSRGIRISLANIPLFKTQIRAILRAGEFGKIGVMFPLISSYDEAVQAKSILEVCIEELKKENNYKCKDLEIGVMIEVPSAVMITPHLAEIFDFFSIGTNDLIQYTIAVDRTNEKLADLFQATHPAVIQFLEKTVLEAHKKNIWVGICGEMASDFVILPLLIGLGFEELSVAPVQLLKIKYCIRKISYQECQKLAQVALTKNNASEIYNLCKEYTLTKYPELFN